MADLIQILVGGVLVGGLYVAVSIGFSLSFGVLDIVDLASEVLLLPAGRYRMEMSVSGNLPEDAGIGWKVNCLPVQRTIFMLPIRTSQRTSGEFAVPADCGAQRVTLAAQADESPQSADFGISGLRLTRIGS